GVAKDPCLSESLMRNPESGVVSYLGSSRYGWIYPGTATLGISFQYERNFYKNLFSPNFPDKTWGALVANAKYQQVSKCKSNGSPRWVQFALNPMGDPEMYIFAKKPQIISGFKMRHNSDKLTLCSEVDSCRLSIRYISGAKAGFQEVLYNTKVANFKVPIGYFNVGAYRPGYLPLTYKAYNIQNETLTNFKAPETDYVEIGNSISNSEPHGNVVFKSGQNQINAKEVILQAGTEVCLGAELVINQK
ncbi:MAG: hypothetical protein K2M37_00830, partial [Muribaculaceae bacterium]|nr:hypothetical protein [Muribaculaceae bacterium]